VFLINLPEATLILKTAVHPEFLNVTELIITDRYFDFSDTGVESRLFFA
jgi:hypothetical protein